MFISLGIDHFNVMDTLINEIHEQFKTVLLELCPDHSSFFDEQQKPHYSYYFDMSPALAAFLESISKFPASWILQQRALSDFILFLHDNIPEQIYVSVRENHIFVVICSELTLILTSKNEIIIQFANDEITFEDSYSKVLESIKIHPSIKTFSDLIQSKSADVLPLYRDRLAKHEIDVYTAEHFKDKLELIRSYDKYLINDKSFKELLVTIFNKKDNHTIRAIISLVDFSAQLVNKKLKSNSIMFGLSDNSSNHDVNPCMLGGCIYQIVFNNFSLPSATFKNFYLSIEIVDDVKPFVISYPLVDEMVNIHFLTLDEIYNHLLIMLRTDIFRIANSDMASFTAAHLDLYSMTLI